jgi:hypothetical protein
VGWLGVLTQASVRAGSWQFVAQLVRMGPAKQPKRALDEPETLTVFVATCQVVPGESNPSADSSSGAAMPVFKQEKFPAVVLPSAKMEDLQRFIASQWTISKSPFAKLPLDEHFYTFKGRILRLDGMLDGYCASTVCKACRTLANVCSAR